MGVGIVQLLSQADCVESVTWFSRNPVLHQQSLKFVTSRWDSMVKKQKIDHEDIKRYFNKISLTSSYEDFSKTEFLIEVVSERIETKKFVVSEASRHISPDTIFASNTSSLSITEISTSAFYRNNFIGMHFFNPAPVMKLVEVVSGLWTSSIAKSFVLDFAKQLGKSPVPVSEAPGFVVNRMLIPMINEGIALYAEGVASREDIDSAMVLGANHPVGPLSLADLIGNDICLSIMDTLYRETGDSKYRAHPLLRKMVRGGKLGRKSGEGFFVYG